MKKKILVSLGVTLAAAAALAASLPSINVTTRLSYAVTTSTNAAPTLVSSNVPGLVRAWFAVQNTNAQAVALYTATSGSPAAVLSQGAQWQTTFPVLDAQNYYARATDGSSQTLLVSEAWGQ